jgi:hypothetical protein
MATVSALNLIADAARQRSREGPRKKMKLRTALTATALAALMSIPFAANAQAYGQRGHQQQNSQDQSRSRGSTDSRQRDDQRRQQQSQNQQRQQEDRRRNEQDQQRRQEQQRQSDQRRRDDGQRRQNEQWQQDQWRRNQQDQQRRLDEQRRQEQLRQQEQRRRDQEWQNQRHRDSDRWQQQNRSYRYYREDHRDWRDIFFSAGFFNLTSLFQSDNRICFDGNAGGLYSISQYDRDCQSSYDQDRARAAFFGQTYFYRDGRRYDRCTVTRNGDRYFQFVLRI